MARIFAIDDDPDTLWILGATLAAGGHELVPFTDPHAGLAAIEAQAPDVLLLDVMMPGMSGFEVLEALRASAFGEFLPTILLSAIGDPPHRVRGLRLGADDFLSKPFDNEELLARIDRLLGRRSTAKEQLSGGLSSYPLSELLQNLAQSGRSGRLALSTAEGPGRIYLQSGAVVAAGFGTLEGSEAMIAMLTQREGGFSFYDGATAGGSTSALALTPILLHAAWLEDELSRRQHLLPRAGELLRLAAPPPAYPEELADLPFDRLLAALARPLSLAELERELGVAPASCQLALAWLIEAGAVRADRTAPAPPAAATDEVPPVDAVAFDDDLRVAVTELQQLALFRGFGSLHLKVEVLAADMAAWREVAPVIATLPDVLLGEDPHLARSRMWSGGGGAVEIPGDEGTAVVRFVSPNSGATPEVGDDPPPTAVALWACTEIEIEERRRLVSEIERRAGKAMLLYIESGTGAAFVPGDRWGVAPQPPRSLLDLLTTLCETGS